MIRLTEYEQKMLDGEMGEFKQKALQFIVKYAQVLDAKELCEINRATIFIGAQHYLDCFDTDNYDEIFSKFYLNSDKVIEIGEFDENCFSQTCISAGVTRDCNAVHQTKEFCERNNRFFNITKDAGVSIAHTCTPYYTGWVPLQGEHYVTTESSNVLISNSVFGAYGNSDGIEAAVCSAICGRSPLWGYHLKENRHGTVVFNIQCRSKTEFDWDVIGYMVGKFLPPHANPIISGNFEKPNIHKLRQCFASMATTSGAEICHIVGVTPEARTIEDALGGKEAIAYIDITEKDYADCLEMVCDAGSGPVDLVSVGCPHLALEEIQKIAIYLRNKKVKENVELWIWTSMGVRAMADYNGYTAIIETSGAKLLESSCPVVMKEECHKHAKSMVMNGLKQAHVMRAQTSAKIYCGDILTCIEAAIAGRWEAE